MVKLISSWSPKGLSSLPQFIWALFIAILLAILLTYSVMAGCGGPPMAPEDYFSVADAVFVGKATSNVNQWELPDFFTKITFRRPGTRIRQVTYTTFNVREAYKGVTTSQVVVETRCIAKGTVHFQVGKEYVVYARVRDGHYEIDPGSGTDATRNAVQDLAYLATLRKLTPTVSTVAPKTICIAIAVMLLLLGTVTGTLFIYRKS